MASTGHTIDLTRVLWTFQVRGGHAFSFTLDAHPKVQHDGAMSLWSLYLSDGEARAVEAHAVSNGSRVTRHAELPNTEQLEERDTMMSAQRGEIDFLTIQCPSCFWMDMNVVNRCGLVVADSPTRETALTTFLKAREDAISCPIR